MYQRRALQITLATVAATLVLASAAWACVTVEGTATIKAVVHKSDVTCPEDEHCAAPGDIVKVTGTGATPRTPFFLHFRNYERTSAAYQHYALTGSHCLGNQVEDDVRISKTSTLSDARGNISLTRGVIPKSAKPSSEYGGLLGPALLCFIDRSENFVTAGDTLTII